ncbi:MAG: co-chaperone DjlA [Salinisphaera sp.]|nr:co-chaperone DjlA [Salinisphaera sp.]
MIIGALIGFALDRGTGLVLGVFVGYGAGVLFRLLRTRHAFGAIQSQFLDSTFAVMGALAKADGTVSRDEIRVAELQFDRLRLSAEQRQAAKAAFRRGKEPDFALDAEVAQFRRAAHGRTPLLQMFLQVQISAVAADGQLHPAEHAMLLQVGRGLGLSEDAVRRLEAMLASAGRAQGAQAARSRQSLDDAYRVLGLNPAATDTDVKRAYRRQMSQNHPDKLAGRGMPESMRALAGERTRAITGAYETISQARA